MLPKRRTFGTEITLRALLLTRVVVARQTHTGNCTYSIKNISYTTVVELGGKCGRVRFLLRISVRDAERHELFKARSLRPEVFCHMHGRPRKLFAISCNKNALNYSIQVRVWEGRGGGIPRAREKL